VGGGGGDLVAGLAEQDPLGKGDLRVGGASEGREGGGGEERESHGEGLPGMGSQREPRWAMGRARGERAGSAERWRTGRRRRRTPQRVTPRRGERPALDPGWRPSGPFVPDDFDGGE